MTTPPAIPIIAITGATGYVGRFVVDELHSHGATVRALVRPQSDRNGFAAAVEWIEGDLQAGAELKRLVRGADSVVHMAYEHVAGRYRGGEGDDLSGWLDANVMGSLRLLTLAAEAGVSRFVFLSSRAVFSSTENGRLLDESHPVSPDTHYGAYKTAVESFLRSFKHQHGMLTFGVRATGVYGLTWPITSSKWWGLIRSTLDGATEIPPKGGTEVHGSDVARVVWALLSRPEPEVADLDVVHLSDLYVTNADIMRIARRLASIPAQMPMQRPMPPTNPLECRALQALGIQLGGVAALEATIQELVRAAQTCGTGA